MDWSLLFEAVGKIATGLGAAAGAWWALVNWRKQDEMFPRITFEVSANFIGVQDDQVVTELVATLENTGPVPLQIRAFDFKLRGVSKSAPLEKGGEAIRGQLLFPAVLDEGEFVPRTWDYSFVYPGVRTEYNFVTAVPTCYSFVRLEASFKYVGRVGRSHHAAKILAIPTAT